MRSLQKDDIFLSFSEKCVSTKHRAKIAKEKSTDNPNRCVQLAALAELPVAPVYKGWLTWFATSLVVSLELMFT
jgi:hypothetical protein